MGRQWELQLLLPFSFYIDAKVLLFFELAKFNLECEPHGQKCGTGGRGGLGGLGGLGDEWENYSVIVRLSFAHRLLFLYCSLRFLIFTSSKFFILLSYFDCISIC